MRRLRGGAKIMTKGKYTKGFTLVELLVVIAIIAILAGALFLVINPANLMMKARDARRISDLTELNKSLGLALADEKITLVALGTTAAGNGTLDSCTVPSTSIAGSLGWVRFTPTAATTGMGEFLSALPLDPKNVAPGCYYFDSQIAAAGIPASWELNAVLESADSVTKMANDGGNSPLRYELGTAPGLTLI